jgi:hypothetical protein
LQPFSVLVGKYLLDKLKNGLQLFELFTPLQWSHALQLPGMHKKGITCLAGRMVSDTVAIFASTSSDGIVVIWEMAIEPTPGGKIASLWIANITVRSLIFCHADLTIQTLILILFYFMILTVLGNVHCICT